MPSKKLTSSQLKKFRSDVAKLKAKGLVSKSVDARSQKPTRHMLSQVKKFDDVLSGKAKVVHAPKRSEAKAFSEKYKVKGKSIVVPAKPDERLTYSKKSGTISAVRKTKDGKKITRDLYAEGVSKGRAPRRRKNALYVIPLGGGRQSFDTWEDLVLFMEPYERNPANPYREWEKYVEVVSVDDAEDE